tara:strand:+ start:560 stop:1423 length:864 start_codon:yes stop_codon:yes gene_type:complete
MKSLQSLLFGGLTAAFSPLAVFGYTGWTGDYDGSSDNTLLLYTFEEGAGSISSANIASGTGALADTPMSISTTNTTMGVEGKFGDAFQSNLPSAGGNSGYGQIPGTNLGSNLSLSEMTVELWYKPLASDVIPAAVSYLVDYRYSSSSGFQFAFFESDNSFRAYVGNGTSLLVAIMPVVDLNFTEDTWTHLAMTYEDGVGLKVYQDGDLIGEKLSTTFGTLEGYNGNMRIGNRVGSSYNSQPGDYDNFRVSDVAYDFTTPIPEAAHAGAAFGIICVVMVSMSRRRWLR